LGRIYLDSEKSGMRKLRERGPIKVNKREKLVTKKSFTVRRDPRDKEACKGKSLKTAPPESKGGKRLIINTKI